MSTDLIGEDAVQKLLGGSSMKKKITHKVFLIQCECGNTFEISERRRCDLDTGVDGILFCTRCTKVLFPSNLRKAKIDTVIKIRRGKDPHDD